MGRIIQLETRRDLGSQELLDDLAARLEHWQAQVHELAVRLAADAVLASQPNLSREEIERALDHEDLLASSDPAAAHLADLDEALGATFYELLMAGAAHPACRRRRKRTEATATSPKGSGDR